MDNDGDCIFQFVQAAMTFLTNNYQSKSNKLQSKQNEKFSQSRVRL